MEILFFCPRWGSEHTGWNEWLPRVKAAGYHGVEWAIAGDTPVRRLEEAWAAAARHGLAIIPQHFDTQEPDFDRHLSLYRSWLERIRPFPALKINSQTGRDIFSFGENKALIDTAAASGLPVVHETHRGKFSFAAHITGQYLSALPGIRLTLDVSHWCAVAESYLGDQADVLQLATGRTDHIHARVGYPQGPQVSDPRSAIFREALERHLAWWDTVVALKRAKGETLTITPEFGPYPYMVHDPSTGMPLAGQWELNIFMMELLKKRYRPYVP